MSILNLGLQSVGLMQAKMNDESEKLIGKVSTMNEIRKITKEHPNLKKDLIESLQALIHLINDVFNCQFLKNELFRIFAMVSETEIKRF